MHLLLIVMDLDLTMSKDIRVFFQELQKLVNCTSNYDNFMSECQKLLQLNRCNETLAGKL